MRVLHLSNTPLSNAPHNLAVCQQTYGIEADLLLHRDRNINKTHVGNGTCWTALPLAEIEARLNAADVIHFHNFARQQELFKTHPHLWEIVAKKPRVIQYHSPRNSTESFEDTINDKSMKHAVIAQYHVRQYPECEFVVPNVIPIFEQRYMPIETKWRDIVPTVSYAPSNITLKDWDNKGYQFTQPVLQRLQAECHIQADVMIGVPYAECMTRKRWSHIGIDEVATGSYHLSSLEYLSMGCLTVGRLDDQTKAALLAVNPAIDLQTLPWIETNSVGIRECLHECIRLGMSGIKQRAKYSRDWMENFWHPRDHVLRFKQIYETL